MSRNIPRLFGFGQCKGCSYHTPALLRRLHLVSSPASPILVEPATMVDQISESRLRLVAALWWSLSRHRQYGKQTNAANSQLPDGAEALTIDIYIHFVHSSWSVCTNFTLITGLPRQPITLHPHPILPNTIILNSSASPPPPSHSKFHSSWLSPSWSDTLYHYYT